MELFGDVGAAVGGWVQPSWTGAVGPPGGWGPWPAAPLAPLAPAPLPVQPDRPAEPGLGVAGALLGGLLAGVVGAAMLPAMRGIAGALQHDAHVREAEAAALRGNGPPTAPSGFSWIDWRPGEKHARLTLMSGHSWTTVEVHQRYPFGPRITDTRTVKRGAYTEIQFCRVDEASAWDTVLRNESAPSLDATLAEIRAVAAPHDAHVEEAKQTPTETRPRCVKHGSPWCQPCNEPAPIPEHSPPIADLLDRAIDAHVACERIGLDAKLGRDQIAKYRRERADKVGEGLAAAARERRRREDRRLAILARVAQLAGAFAAGVWAALTFG